MPDTFQAGDRIRLHFLDAPGHTLDVTVCAMLSDQQEGLAPEIADYVACWLEVSKGSCSDAEHRLSLSLGTDFQYSLDGRHLTIEKLAGQQGGTEV